MLCSRLVTRNGVKIHFQERILETRAPRFAYGHDLVVAEGALASMFLTDPMGPVLGRTFLENGKQFKERPPNKTGKRGIVGDDDYFEENIGNLEADEILPALVAPT